MNRIHTRVRVLLLVAVLAPLLAGCGIAESIAEGQIDDRDVTVRVNSAKSGVLERRLDGTDVVAIPTILRTGDQPDNDFEMAVMAFSIQPELQPNNTKLKSVRLRVFVSGLEGDPSALLPLLVSHLPGHPDAPLSVGVVPNPPSAYTGDLAAPTVGWHEFDVTNAFRVDWDALRQVSAFVVFCTTGSDSNGTLDAVRFGYDGDPGGGPAPELILTFGADVNL